MHYKTRKGSMFQNIRIHLTIYDTNTTMRTLINYICVLSYQPFVQTVPLNRALNTSTYKIIFPRV